MSAKQNFAPLHRTGHNSEKIGHLPVQQSMGFNIIPVPALLHLLQLSYATMKWRKCENLQALLQSLCTCCTHGNARRRIQTQGILPYTANLWQIRQRIRLQKPAETASKVPVNPDQRQSISLLMLMLITNFIFVMRAKRHLKRVRQVHFAGPTSLHIHQYNTWLYRKAKAVANIREKVMQVEQSQKCIHSHLKSSTSVNTILSH